MQKIINTCDRCGKVDIKEGTSKWGVEIPHTWSYVCGKLLCDDCLKKYNLLFDFFVESKSVIINLDSNDNMILTSLSDTPVRGNRAKIITTNDGDDEDYDAPF